MFNEQGFRKQYNYPGQGGGETNGLYAAATVNDVVPVSTLYLQDNVPDQFDFNDVGEILDTIGNTYIEIEQRRAEAERLRREAERAAQPTVGDQFTSLSFWEKAAFVFAVAGFAFIFVMRR